MVIILLHVKIKKDGMVEGRKICAIYKTYNEILDNNRSILNSLLML